MSGREPDESAEPGAEGAGDERAEGVEGLVSGGTLYLVATPIGNLDDFSPRGQRVLGAVDAIAAEDTRHTGQLLSRFGIRRPLVSYHDHNKERRTPELIERLRAGEAIAIVSDAGSPGISDPAFTLVRAAVEAGLSIVPIPGPSSALCALEISGLPTDRFAFEGFLPRKSGRRRTRIEELRPDPRTLIFFESPHRLRATLADLLAGMGDRPASVSRELTKKFEETRRGPLSALVQWAEERSPRGEFVIVVGGLPRPKRGREDDDEEETE
ncbi:MAG TPA: 16S rRNA (cytidine(1402)-2'-O)-methyltransferase [Candidatus Eisenbacteria bacterium]|nr:16S rRNA (cytidine(1402)-2'-O)-methyltransferase [Candidatus Eisenbacteria bacterium]